MPVRPSEPNDGIPVPGIPLSMIWTSSPSVCRCVFELVAMSGARSPPRPSKPWHPAHRDSNACRPSAADGSTWRPSVVGRGDFWSCDATLATRSWTKKSITDTPARRRALTACLGWVIGTQPSGHARKDATARVVRKASLKLAPELRRHLRKCMVRFALAMRPNCSLD